MKKSNTIFCVLLAVVIFSVGVIIIVVRHVGNTELTRRDKILNSMIAAAKTPEVRKYIIDWVESTIQSNPMAISWDHSKFETHFVQIPYESFDWSKLGVDIFNKDPDYVAPLAIEAVIGRDNKWHLVSFDATRVGLVITNNGDIGEYAPKIKFHLDNFSVWLDDE